MNQPEQYTPEWFGKQKGGALASAEIILPIVFDLVAPQSVVDVGCGVGMWLSYCLAHGVHDVLGIDGNYVKAEQLHIPEENFKTLDISKPFHIDKKADLVICLEVGEHLPESSAHDFVVSLTNIAPVILFSAAIPYQPGTHHINMQWPEYWAALFKKQGYAPVDCIRRKVWTNPKVEYWYAQNSILYVKESDVSKYPLIEREIAHGYSSALPLVHPRRYFYALKPAPSLFFRIKRKIRSLIGKIGIS